jgi:hypothetical protein
MQNDLKEDSNKHINEIWKSIQHLHKKATWKRNSAKKQKLGKEKSRNVINEKYHKSNKTPSGQYNHYIRSSRRKNIIDGGQD